MKSGSTIGAKLRLLMVALAVGVPLAVVPSLPAHAAGCYDGSVWTPRLTGGPSNTLTPSSSGYYTTSTRCNDINFVVVSTPGTTNWSALTRVCWVSTGTCNSWKSVPWDSNFHVIASNVRDGTRFRIETHWPESMWGSQWSTKVAY